MVKKDSSNKNSNKSNKQIVHYQTLWMKSHNATVCGRRNISTSVRTTIDKSKCTCKSCLKYIEDF